MKEFFKKLFSDNGEVSSKRVVGFLTFLLIAETVNAVLWWNRSIPEFIFYGLVILVAACFGLNTIIDVFSKKGGDNGKL